MEMCEEVDTYKDKVLTLAKLDEIFYEVQKLYEEEENWDGTVFLYEGEKA